MGEAVTVDAAFSPEECETILAAAVGLERQEGGIGGVGVTNHARRATTQWLPRDLPEFSWVYERVINVTLKANGEAWGFERIEGTESIQISTYSSAVAGYYNWHADTTLAGDTAEIRNRVLSASVQLSSPEQYTGGGLEVRGSAPAAKTQGAMIVFPSYLMHKVHPVESGERVSLVMWFLGKEEKFWAHGEHAYKENLKDEPEFLPASACALLSSHRRVATDLSAPVADDATDLSRCAC
jgi:PKHD-type hydroxylase